MEPKRIIVAGIGTEVGKTVVSAILVETLKADYWKPVQSGDLHHTDTMKVSSWISNEKSVFHPEGVRLQEPMSPHAAADLENITIKPSNLSVPVTNNDLIIELAGGLMVPINHGYLNIDFIADLGYLVVLVSQYYLGNINHTLMSWNLLRERNIPFLGFIFNGNKNDATFEVILVYTKSKCLLEVNQEDQIDKATIRKYATSFKL